MIRMATAGSLRMTWIRSSASESESWANSMISTARVGKEETSPI
jgi:hypothetical protein